MSISDQFPDPPPKQTKNPARRRPVPIDTTGPIPEQFAVLTPSDYLQSVAYLDRLRTHRRYTRVDDLQRINWLERSILAYLKKQQEKVTCQKNQSSTRP